MKKLSFRLAFMLTLLLLASGAYASQLPDFTKIVKNNAAAVVHVEAKYNGEHTVPAQQQTPQLPPGMPEIFRRFFGQPHGSPKDRAHISIGSGFIISSDGYILTNDHVVDHADHVSVRLKDRRVLTAKVIGTDKPYDIALLKVDAKDLPTVTVGDSSKLEPGEWVLAIGSPFDFDYTVTQGVVSAVGRSFGSQDQADVPFIQTDVPINHGNSGGPLFNLDGQVVGINSQIYSSTGGYMGVSFSIPINIAMDAVKQIKSKGYVSRGLLGVTIQQVDADKAKALGLKSASGALIASVKKGSPADKAGLKVGDVILSYRGEKVLGANHLPPLVAATAPGTKVVLGIWHQGKEENVTVKVGEKPRNTESYSSIASGATTGSGALGFTVEDLTSDQRDALDIKKDQGVVISQVTGRQASKSGIRAGQVILMVGQHNVANTTEFEKYTKNIKAGDTVLLLVRLENGTTRFITIDVPSKKK